MTKISNDLRSQHIVFAGLEFRGLTRELLFGEEKDAARFIITVNAELITLAHHDSRFRRLVSENFTTFDGQWPYAIARLLNPGFRFEKISGTDLIYDLSAFAAATGKRVFLLGADPQVNAAAVSRLEREFNIEVQGYSPPPHSYPMAAAESEGILERLRVFRPQILAVCFGTPKQEYWLDDHRARLTDIGVRYMVGLGGTMDIVARKYRRAPRFLQKIGAEGLWRLAQDPGTRLARLPKVIKFLRYI